MEGYKPGLRERGRDITLKDCTLVAKGQGRSGTSDIVVFRVTTGERSWQTEQREHFEFDPKLLRE